jgi:hypothetical protein
MIAFRIPAAEHPGKGQGHLFAGQDAAVEVDRHDPHGRVPEEDGQGRVEPGLVGRAAPHVQDVRGRKSGEIEPVHGGHGQARAVGQKPHESGQLDERKPPVPGRPLHRVQVPGIRDAGLGGDKRGGVVVEFGLAVQGQKRPLPGQDQGVDFGQKQAPVGQHGEEIAGQGRKVRPQAGRKPQMEKGRPDLVRGRAARQPEVLDEHVSGPALHVHPAPPAGRERHGPSGPGHGHGQVHLPGHVRRRLQAQEGRPFAADGQPKSRIAAASSSSGSSMRAMPPALPGPRPRPGT